MQHRQVDHGTQQTSLCRDEGHARHALVTLSLIQAILWMIIL